MPSAVVTPISTPKSPSRYASRIARPHAARRSGHEALLLALLLAERLDDAQAPSTSCTTDSAPLSSRFVSSHCDAHAPAVDRVSTKSGGSTTSATSASCQSIRAVTTIIPARVTAAVTNGVRPYTARSLHRGRVVLDPVGRVGRAARVVVREREPLHCANSAPRMSGAASRRCTCRAPRARVLELDEQRRSGRAAATQKTSRPVARVLHATAAGSTARKRRERLRADARCRPRSSSGSGASSASGVASRLTHEEAGEVQPVRAAPARRSRAVEPAGRSPATSARAARGERAKAGVPPPQLGQLVAGEPAREPRGERDRRGAARRRRRAASAAAPTASGTNAHHAPCRPRPDRRPSRARAHGEPSPAPARPDLEPDELRPGAVVLDRDPQPRAAEQAAADLEVPAVERAAVRDGLAGRDQRPLELREPLLGRDPVLAPDGERLRARASGS